MEYQTWLIGTVCGSAIIFVITVFIAYKLIQLVFESIVDVADFIKHKREIRKDK